MGKSGVIGWFGEQAKRGDEAGLKGRLGTLRGAVYGMVRPVIGMMRPFGED